MTTAAAGKKFDGELSEYPEQFLRCRGLRNHTWRFETDFKIATNVRGRVVEFTRTLSCMACTTQRDDVYSVKPTGKFVKIRTQYHYADGYQMRRGGQIELDAARDALIMKELERTVEAELFHRIQGMRTPEARAQNVLPLRAAESA